VVQGHAHVAEHGAAKPRAVQRLAACLQIGGIGTDPRQRTAQRRDAFLRHQVHDRVAFDRIEPLGGMRDGIDAAGHAQGHRQRHGQLRVVDDHARQHAQVAAGLLQATLGDAVDRRHLAAGIGGRDGQDRQAGIERDGLAQARGGSAANGYRAIGAQPARQFPGLAGGLDRHMHHRAIEHAGGSRTEQAGDSLSAGALFGRRQH
jgi:hypothetical protein